MCCGNLVSSLLAGNAKWSPCSQAAPWAFESSMFSAFPMSEKLILVKEEEEKGNEMAFGKE